jgi:hypothetical protein
MIVRLSWKEWAERGFYLCSNPLPTTDVKIGKVFHGNVNRAWNGKLCFGWITFS